MSVLRFKDENGDIVEITAIKGEPAIIDTQYNPQSKNAQSGTAVAEAIAALKAYIDERLGL